MTSDPYGSFYRIVDKHFFAISAFFVVILCYHYSHSLNYSAVCQKTSVYRVKAWNCLLEERFFKLGVEIVFRMYKYTFRLSLIALVLNRAYTTRKQKLGCQKYTKKNKSRTSLMSHLRAQVTQQITPTGLSVGVVKNGKQNLLSRKYETNERHWP